MVKESQSPGAGGGAGRKQEEPEVGRVQVLLETRAGNAAREPQRSSVESPGLEEHMVGRDRAGDGSLCRGCCCWDGCAGTKASPVSQDPALSCSISSSGADPGFRAAAGHGAGMGNSGSLGTG